MSRPRNYSETEDDTNDPKAPELTLPPLHQVLGGRYMLVVSLAENILIDNYRCIGATTVYTNHPCKLESP